MHARYFRVFWVSWILIGCSMRVVYSECMNVFSIFSDIPLAIFTLCMVYLRVEPRSGEWIHCFNLPVLYACNALRLMDAQVRLRLIAYPPHCAYILARDLQSWKKIVGTPNAIYYNFPHAHHCSSRKWGMTLFNRKQSPEFLLLP